MVECLLQHGADTKSITDETLKTLLKWEEDEIINILLLYNLQIEKRSPDLISSFLKKNRSRGFKCAGANKIIKTYRGKIFSEVERLIYHLYFRPPSPAFYRAVG